MYRHKKIIYIFNLYARAIASETYRPLFSHMVYGAINDSIGQNTDIEITMNKLCERARKLFPFSHSKTAISFNILLVGLLQILYLRNTIYFQVSNYIFIYIQSMQFPVITYGMAFVL